MPINCGVDAQTWQIHAMDTSSAMKDANDNLNEPQKHFAEPKKLDSRLLSVPFCLCKAFQKQMSGCIGMWGNIDCRGTEGLSMSISDT